MNFKTIGCGRDIIFLHGWGGSISSFLFIAKPLSKKYRVTLVDFAGFGETPEPAFAYNVSDYAKDVINLCDMLNIKTAVFAGHSFGGRVALELAAKYPERTAALALIDSAGIKPRRKLSYYFKITVHKLLKKIGMKGLNGSADYSVLSPVMKNTFKNIVNYDQTPLLNSILHQTAIFWGDKDNETPLYMARTLKKGLRNSELFMLNGGHFAYCEDSMKFFAILSAFLDGLKLYSLEEAFMKEDDGGCNQ